MDVARQAEVLGVQNFICRRVVQDGLGVDAGLVSKGTEAGDGVVKGGIDFYRLGNHILNLLDHAQLVLALDIIRVRNDHACQEATKRSNAISFSDCNVLAIDIPGSSKTKKILTSENTGINVSCTSLKSTEARIKLVALRLRVNGSTYALAIAQPVSLWK